MILWLHTSISVQSLQALLLPNMVFLYFLWVVQVKMVTADDDSVTDILCEGPEEEMMRLSKELGLNEKGKELVKGLLER